jgi:hypothetical protein
MMQRSSEPSTASKAELLEKLLCVRIRLQVLATTLHANQQIVQTHILGLGMFLYFLHCEIVCGETAPSPSLSELIREVDCALDQVDSRTHEFESLALVCNKLRPILGL